MDWQLAVTALLLVFVTVSIVARWNRMDRFRRIGTLLLFGGAVLVLFADDLAAATGVAPLGSAAVDWAAIAVALAGLLLVALGSESDPDDRPSGG